jgi:CHAT domain-containing protein
LALSDFEALQESENVALVRSLTAECLTNLGDLPAAWKFYLDSMSLMGNLRDPLRRQEFLETGSESALREDKPATALVFMREALGDSYAPTVESFYCLRWRVLAHCRLRQWEEARKDLREARLLVAKYTDNAAQESLRGDLLSMEGEVLKQESPAASLVHLNQAIKTYESTSYRQQLALLHAERARSYLALNQETAAERDFDLAIQALQRQRSAVSDDNLRALFLDEFRGIFDDMVALQARLGRKGLALDYAESTKAQVLRELMTSAESDRQHPPLKNEEVQKNLPRNVAVVEYSVLPKSLLTWVIRRSSLSLVKTDITAEEVQSLVEDFRGKILRRSAAQYRDARSRDLSQLLIGKIRGSIQGVNHLVLVPDRRLYEVPFAALPDRGSSKYLVESYSLSIAPSVNTYLDALERERVLGRSQALKILVLGNPTLDPLLAPNLPSLSYSEREARNVKGLYPDARLLLGRDATRFSFLEGLARFDVVHFAGHSAAFPAAPLSSFLAFAPGPNDSGILYSRDLFQARGVRAQVVILSSCESLSSDGRSGEGVASLARALLSSGVPVVVGSLWSIDDQKSEKLLVLFHRYFRSGHSAVDALRRAQLDLLSTPDTAPVHWAGFQLIGANARCSLDRERIGDE